MRHIFRDKRLLSQGLLHINPSRSLLLKSSLFPQHTYHWLGCLCSWSVLSLAKIILQIIAEIQRSLSSFAPLFLAQYGSYIKAESSSYIGKVRWGQREVCLALLDWDKSIWKQSVGPRIVSLAQAFLELKVSLLILSWEPQ